jgi:hypothetical protein
MPLAETLEHEAGDDRNKDVEIAKLEEKFNYGSTLFESDTPGYAPGEVVFHEYRLTPLSLELRRENRKLGRRIVGLALSQSFPIQSPQPNRKAHIRRVDHLNLN